MKYKPLTLSIIIPVFNEEDYLEDCLESIAGQTIAPNEVIVVDNNSTDDSLKIAEKYGFVRVVGERRQGIVFARDKGFNIANSDLLGRIDADTVLAADWVEKVLSSYQDNQNGQDFALSGKSYYRNLKIFGKSTIVIDVFYYLFSRLALGHHTLFGSNMVVPKSAWDEVKSYVCTDDKYHEDIDLAVHLAKSLKIVKSNNIASGVASRINDKPGGLAIYILRWIDTIRHGWRVNSLDQYSFVLQIKNLFMQKINQ